MTSATARSGKTSGSSTIFAGPSACARKCPVGAISGDRKQVHLIDGGKCIKCGACADACKLDAVLGV